MRETVASRLTMPEDVAADLRPEEFDAEVDREELERIGELVLKDGVIDHEADLDELIAEQRTDPSARPGRPSDVERRGPDHPVQGRSAH